MKTIASLALAACLAASCSKPQKESFAKYKDIQGHWYVISDSYINHYNSSDSTDASYILHFSDSSSFFFSSGPKDIYKGRKVQPFWLFADAVDQYDHFYQDSMLYFMRNDSIIIEYYQMDNTKPSGPYTFRSSEFDGIVNYSDGSADIVGRENLYDLTPARRGLLGYQTHDILLKRQP